MAECPCPNPLPAERLSRRRQFGKRLPRGQDGNFDRTCWGAAVLKGGVVRVSLSTIAAEAGVSIATVSRIANGSAGPRQPGYGRARAGPVVAPRLPSQPDRPLAASAGKPHRGDARAQPRQSGHGRDRHIDRVALRAAGYVMILCDTHDQPDLQDEYLTEMRAQLVRGYVLVSPVPSDGLKALTSGESPQCSSTARAGYAERAMPFVGIDNAAAGAMAAQMLLEAGIGQPAILHSSLASSAIADRVRGARERLMAGGLSEADIRVASSDRLRHLEAGYEAAQKLTASGGWPEGLVCTSDQMAYGAFRLARETGVDVPGACRMVGIDENR